MKIYSRRKGNKKGTETSIPNVLAFTFVRNFLVDKNHEDMRKQYFINNLDSNQINKVMKDVKWLFNEYKGLDIVTIKNTNEDSTKFIL